MCLSWIGTSKFTGLQWEDFMIFGQERPGQNLPAWVAKITISLMSSFLPTISLCLCYTVNLGIWWPWAASNASVNPVCTGGSGTHCDCNRPCHWGLLSSGSGDMPYYFWPLQQNSYCHCTTPGYKHSVLSGPGVKVHLQHIEPESSHWYPLSVWAVLILACIMWDEKASDGLSILGCNYFIVLTGVWLPCISFTIFYCSCSPVKVLRR